MPLDNNLPGTCKWVSIHAAKRFHIEGIIDLAPKESEVNEEDRTVEKGISIPVHACERKLTEASCNTNMKIESSEDMHTDIRKYWKFSNSTIAVVSIAIMIAVAIPVLRNRR